MDTLQELPEQQARLLQESIERLGGVLGPDECILGGGTALAARWRHRESLDIDLFTTGAIFRRIKPALDECVEGWREEGGLESVRVHPSAVHCTTKDGLEFSLAGGDDITREPVSGERERTAGVRLQATAEIVARKIRARMVNRASYLVRDSYDVVCCLLHDPVAVEEALSALVPSERASLEYDATRRDLRLDQSQPLVEPVYRHLQEEASLREVMFAVLTAGSAREREGLREGVRGSLQDRDGR